MKGFSVESHLFLIHRNHTWNVCGDGLQVSGRRFPFPASFIANLYSDL